MKTFPRNDQALQAEREKDSERDEGRSSSWSNFHFLKPGRTVLRILPAYSEKGVWFRKLSEYCFEADGQKFFLTSPKDTGDRDPLYEWGQAVYEKGNEAAIKEAKKFRPRTQFLYNAVILSNSGEASPADGVKILKTGVTVKRALVDLDTDVDSGFGDITNLETGFNVIIDREGEGLDTKYTVKVHREQSNLITTLAGGGVNFDELELFDLDELLPAKSFDELQGILEMIRNPGMQSTPAPAPEVADSEVADSPVMETPVSEDELVAMAPPPVYRG